MPDYRRVTLVCTPDQYAVIALETKEADGELYWLYLTGSNPHDPPQGEQREYYLVPVGDQPADA